MKLFDLTLHPVAPEFVSATFRRWLVSPPAGMGEDLEAALERAQAALSLPGEEAPRPRSGRPRSDRLAADVELPTGGGPTALESALGTALAYYEVYWLERSCGLRALSCEDARFGSILRDPLELLDVSLPESRRLGLGPRAVWIPADQMHAFREALRRCASNLREILGAAGVSTYLAALVEASGYCLDRGYGLVELEGVADITHVPNGQSCRAFFERSGRPPAQAAVEAQEISDPVPVAEALTRVEEALEAGEEQLARQLLRELQARDEDGADFRLLRAWLLLRQGETWSAAQLLEGLTEQELAPGLASRCPGLMGWALLATGAPADALPHLRRALESVPCSLDDVERFAHAAIQTQQLLPQALDAVRGCLAQLTPMGVDVQDLLESLEDPELADQIPDAERFAALLALQGRLHASLGFDLHAEHELELALLLDGDLPWAQRWLAELRRRSWKEQ